MLIDEKTVKLLNEAWTPLMRGLAKVFDDFMEVMQKWFPTVSQAHRAEVKRVRTAYDRRRRSRKKKR